MSIFLRQKWVDPRLTFGRVGDTDHVLVTAKDIGHIWKPDLFFPNEKSATLHQVTIPNKLMRIYHNGTVLYTTRSGQSCCSAVLFVSFLSLLSLSLLLLLMLLFSSSSLLLFVDVGVVVFVAVVFLLVMMMMMMTMMVVYIY